MTIKTVPIRDSLERGWGIFKNNVLFIVIVFVVASIVYAVAERADEMAERFIWPGELLVTVGYLVAFAFIELALISITLKLVDTGKAEVEDAFSSFGVFFKFFITFLLYGAMVAIGTLLFVIPGIYLAIKFGFFGYFVVDEKLEPLDALRASSRITDGVKLDLFMFYLLAALLLICGLILLLVGVYIAWPVVRLAIANIYRNLRSQTPNALPDLAAGATGA
ncbi:MAG: hypothetical protein JSW50_02310 [Candidatus Latescibacterota bacterium]|nr:MAG: hypothetical protein JSW50_02310 [Candidatus Latescibacterota bacterium]